MRKKLGIPQRRHRCPNGEATRVQERNRHTNRKRKNRHQKKPEIVFLAVGKGPDFKRQMQTEQLGIEATSGLQGSSATKICHPTTMPQTSSFCPPNLAKACLLVALEAMACGLPVIATNVGGIREIMMEDYGKLVPPNQPESAC